MIHCFLAHLSYILQRGAKEGSCCSCCYRRRFQGRRECYQSYMCMIIDTPTTPFSRGFRILQRYMCVYLLRAASVPRPAGIVTHQADRSLLNGELFIHLLLDQAGKNARAAQLEDSKPSAQKEARHCNSAPLAIHASYLVIGREESKCCRKGSFEALD